MSLQPFQIELLQMMLVEMKFLNHLFVQHNVLNSLSLSLIHIKFHDQLVLKIHQESLQIRVDQVNHLNLVLHLRKTLLLMQYYVNLSLIHI